MPTIRVKENEPFEVAMRRFKRAIEKTGLLTELRAREAYEKPSANAKKRLLPNACKNACAANNCRRKCTKPKRLSVFKKTPHPFAVFFVL